MLPDRMVLRCTFCDMPTIFLTQPKTSMSERKPNGNRLKLINPMKTKEESCFWQVCTMRTVRWFPVKKNGTRSVIRYLQGSWTTEYENIMCSVWSLDSFLSADTLALLQLHIRTSIWASPSHKMLSLTVLNNITFYINHREVHRHYCALPGTVLYFLLFF